MAALKGLPCCKLKCSMIWPIFWRNRSAQMYTCCHTCMVVISVDGKDTSPACSAPSRSALKNLGIFSATLVLSTRARRSMLLLRTRMSMLVACADTCGLCSLKYSHTYIMETLGGHTAGGHQLGTHLSFRSLQNPGRIPPTGLASDPERVTTRQHLRNHLHITAQIRLTEQTQHIVEI